MLRIYLMQPWYGLFDPGMEDSLYDVESMRRFAGVGLDAIPEETTICKFRHSIAMSKFALRQRKTQRDTSGSSQSSVPRSLTPQPQPTPP